MQTTAATNQVPNINLHNQRNLKNLSTGLLRKTLDGLKALQTEENNHDVIIPWHIYTIEEILDFRSEKDSWGGYW